MKALERLIFRMLKGSEWERFNWEIDRKKDIKEACFVVFDTETTGLNFKKDQVISIGAVKIESLRIDLSKSFYILLKTSGKFKESIKVHGIMPQDLEEATDRREACINFIEYSRGCILVGFYVYIDITMIRKLVKENCKGPFYPYAIDLLDLVEDYKASLEDLLKKYQLPISSFHNALEDAYMTALLFLRILKKENYKKIKDLPLRVF